MPIPKKSHELRKLAWRGAIACGPDPSHGLRARDNNFISNRLACLACRLGVTATTVGDPRQLPLSGFRPPLNGPGRDADCRCDFRTLDPALDVEAPGFKLDSF